MTALPRPDRQRRLRVLAATAAVVPAAFLGTGSIAAAAASPPNPIVVATPVPAPLPVNPGGPILPTTPPSSAPPPAMGSASPIRAYATTIRIARSTGKEIATSCRVPSSRVQIESIGALSSWLEVAPVHCGRVLVAASVTAVATSLPTPSPPPTSSPFQGTSGTGLSAQTASSHEVAGEILASARHLGSLAFASDVRMAMEPNGDITVAGLTATNGRRDAITIVMRPRYAAQPAASTS